MNKIVRKEDWPIGFFSSDQLENIPLGCWGHELDIGIPAEPKKYVPSEVLNLEQNPEQKLIDQEKEDFLKLLENIYEQKGIDGGINGLTNYFFTNLELKKYDQIDFILDFLKKITGRILMKVPPQTERRLLREAQIQRNTNYKYIMRFGNTIFGPPKFTLMARKR